MHMRKFAAILLAVLLALSCAVGGAEEENQTVAGNSVVGQVTEVDGAQITIQLGELLASAPAGDGQPPQAPADGQPPETSGGQAPGDATPRDTAPADGNAPSAPSGQTPDGNMPDMPGQNFSAIPGFIAGEETLTFTVTDATAIAVESADGTSDGSLSDISVDSILRVVFGENETIASVTVLYLGEGGMGGPGGFDGGAEADNGSAAATIDEDGAYTSGTYTSTGDDENALRIDGATVELSNIIIDKSGGASSSTENGDFYGANAGLLALNGAQVTLDNITVSTSAQNGNGVFSYGSGTTVNVSDSTITTTADNSGGIQTTGGGTTNAENLTVTTGGNSSAAIRSDRGGGTVNVSGGSYVSNGYNSPAVYSTAQISVKNATLTANNSESLVIEGENSIALENCTVSGNMSDDKGTSSDENVHNVMIYQSMSGDAKVGTSVFSMSGGSLTAKNGDQFYITNTRCELTLCGVRLTSEDVDGVLLRVAGNSASHGWGTAGQNGAQVTFIADGQTLSGDIVVDSISTLTMTLKNGSDFTGVVQIIENAEGGAAVENNVSVTVEQGCTWTLTGDCTLTSLENNGTINFGGYTITLADGTVLR